MPNDQSDDLAKWLTRLLLLIPGYVALTIARQVTDSWGEWNDLELTMASLLMSIAGLVTAATLQRLFLLLVRAKSLPRYFEVSTPLAVMSVGVCILLGALAGASVENEWLLSPAKWLGVTPRVSTLGPVEHTLVLNGRGKVLDHRARPVAQAWLRVMTTKGLVVSGYQAKVGRDSDSPEIYLSPACIENPEPRPVCGPGILVAKEQVAVIELVDETQSACRRAVHALQDERCSDPSAAP